MNETTREDPSQGQSPGDAGDAPLPAGKSAVQQQYKKLAWQVALASAFVSLFFGNEVVYRVTSGKWSLQSGEGYFKHWWQPEGNDSILGWHSVGMWAFLFAAVYQVYTAGTRHHKTVGYVSFIATSAAIVSAMVFAVPASTVAGLHGIFRYTVLSISIVFTGCLILVAGAIGIGMMRRIPGWKEHHPKYMLAAILFAILPGVQRGMVWFVLNYGFTEELRKTEVLACWANEVGFALALWLGIFIMYFPRSSGQRGSSAWTDFWKKASPTYSVAWFNRIIRNSIIIFGLPYAVWLVDDIVYATQGFPDPRPFADDGAPLFNLFAIAKLWIP